ncbi:MAG: hypothetical protein L0177_10960, partial [Chloroflexi bacterium]|nr:hypothetical protein [Chloroflexota bacterium]
MDSGVHLLLLTADHNAARRYFRHLMSAGSCTVVRCEHQQVGRYLTAGDAGLLLREKDAVN